MDFAAPATAAVTGAVAWRLAAAEADRDRAAQAHAEALADVARLQAEVVRLHARIDELAAGSVSSGPRLRGLASLISPAGPAAAVARRA